MVFVKLIAAKRIGNWPLPMTHNKELNNLYSSPNIIRQIKARRMRWAEYVARMGQERKVCKILMGISERKRQLGRPKHRWANENIVTYSGFSIHDGTLLHSRSQYTTVKHSRQLVEHTYTSDPHGLGTPTPIEFFQQDLLWQSSNTLSHSCSQKASKHTSRQSIVGLSIHLHTTTAPRRIVHH
jgi:hypothetical protein